LWYLAVLNVVLAGFNLLPAFPLDGGRIFRSALWGYSGDLRWSTDIASKGGSVLGFLLIFLGIYFFVSGLLIQGIWWFLIGMFLRYASYTSKLKVLMRTALEGERISRFMKRDPVTVPSSLTLRELVDDYFYRYHYKMYPVADSGALKGCITTKDMRKFNKSEWDEHQVKEVMEDCSEDNSIPSNADPVKALEKMQKTQRSRLMVVDDHELKGIIALKDIMKFISLQLDLEEGIYTTPPEA
jgi:predicted transcriptional regulator